MPSNPLGPQYFGGAGGGTLALNQNQSTLGGILGGIGTGIGDIGSILGGLAGGIGPILSLIGSYGLGQDEGNLINAALGQVNKLSGLTPSSYNQMLQQLLGPQAAQLGLGQLTPYQAPTEQQALQGQGAQTQSLLSLLGLGAAPSPYNAPNLGETQSQIANLLNQLQNYSGIGTPQAPSAYVPPSISQQEQGIQQFLQPILQAGGLTNITPYSAPTGAQAAQGIQQLEQPLQQNLLQNVNQQVQAQLANSGLGGASGLAQSIESQALAPYNLAEQQMAQGQFNTNQQLAQNTYLNQLQALLGAQGQAAGEYGQNLQAGQFGATLGENQYQAQLAAELQQQQQAAAEQQGMTQQQLAAYQLQEALRAGAGAQGSQEYNTLQQLGMGAYGQQAGLLQNEQQLAAQNLLAQLGLPLQAIASVPAFPTNANIAGGGGFGGVGGLGSSLGQAGSSLGNLLSSIFGGGGGVVSGLPPASTTDQTLAGMSSVYPGLFGGGAGAAGATGLGAGAALGGIPGLGPASGLGELAGINVPGFGDTAGLAGGTAEGQFAGIGSGGNSGGLGGLLGGTGGAIAGGLALGAGLPLGILALMGINPFSSSGTQAGSNSTIQGDLGPISQGQSSELAALQQMAQQASAKGQNISNDPNLLGLLQGDYNTLLRNSSTVGGIAQGLNPNPSASLYQQATSLTPQLQSQMTSILQSLGATPQEIANIIQQLGTYQMGYGPTEAYTPNA